MTAATAAAAVGTAPNMSELGPPEMSGIVPPVGDVAAMTWNLLNFFPFIFNNN